MAKDGGGWLEITSTGSSHFGRALKRFNEVSKGLFFKIVEW